MANLEFRDPAFLLLTLLVPLAFWLANQRPSLLRYSSLKILDSAPKSLKSRLAILPAVMMSLAVLMFSIAMAGPRTPDAESKVSREGISIMMVIDHSSSMQARDLVKDDYSVNRLSVVKDVFRKFVLGQDNDAGRGRPDDAVGLIAFAGYADSLCPLTLDHGNLTTIVDDLEIVNSREDDGTAIGDGLALAVERLRRSKAKSKIAILLTDGVNNAGAIEPKQAAEVADATGVKVYCIGAGTQGSAPFPSVNPFSGRTELRLMDVEIDEKTLNMIAEKTGGRYFRATDREALASIYAEIDRLERTEVSELRYLQYNEHFQLFLIGGLLLMGVAITSKATLFGALP